MPTAEKKHPHAMIPTVFGPTDLVRKMGIKVLEDALRDNPDLSKKGRALIEAEIKRRKGE